MIDADAVLFPAGRLKLAFFPTLSEGELLDAIDVWLTEAYEDPRVVDLAEAAQDRAAKRWAEYRGLSDLCAEMASEPSEVAQTDAGRYAFAKDQRDTLCNMAARALLEFEESIIPAERIFSGSRTVRNQFSW